MEHLYLISKHNYQSLADMKAAVDLIREMGAKNRGVFYPLSGFVFALPRQLKPSEKEALQVVDFK